MTLASRVIALVGSLLAGTLASSLGLISSAHAAHSDPPGRVARLSDSQGDVVYSPAGENDWLYSVRNRPLIRGDRLWFSRGARAELQVGSAAIRLGENTQNIGTKTSRQKHRDTQNLKAIRCKLKPHKSN